MKNPLRTRLGSLACTLRNTAGHYPVELGLCLYAFVVFALTRESAIFDPDYQRLAVIPLCLTTVYVLNALYPAGRRRLIYYLAVIAVLPAFILMRDCFTHPGERYALTVGLLCPLAILVCRRARDNRLFIREALSYLGAGITAGVLAAVAAALFLAIYSSVIYIFCEPDRVQDGVAVYAFAAAFMLLMPLLLFAALDRLNLRERTGRKATDALLNYIVTPALLAYTALLYLYFIQIAVTWSLPKGGVAVMVFVYMLLAAVVKALQYVVRRPMYGWFFRRLSCYALPPLLLFWSGCLRRVADYGLTEARVYLLLLGGLMTLYVLLFLSRRTGRYLTICFAALVVMTLCLYVPALRPERIAVRSQQARILRLAGELGLTDQAGHIRFDPSMQADTAHIDRYGELYETLQYLARTDPRTVRSMGIADPDRLWEWLPAGWDGGRVPADAFLFIESDMQEGVEAVGYRRLYAHALTTLVENDTLHIRAGGRPECKIPLPELLRHQLAASGLTMDALATADLDGTPAADALCLFQTDSMTLVFHTLILRGDADGYRIENALASVLLIR